MLHTLGKKSYYIIAVVIVLIVVVIVLGDTRNEGEEYAKLLIEEEKLRSSDYIGGETPQETMDLFIKSLEEKDFSQASQYFVIGGSIPQEMWRGFLEDEDENGTLGNLISILKKSEPSSRELATENYKEFIARDEESGEILYSFLFFKNSETGVWKIESI